jgi:hypothetical protein
MENVKRLVEIEVPFGGIDGRSGKRQVEIQGIPKREGLEIFVVRERVADDDGSGYRPSRCVADHKVRNVQRRRLAVGAGFELKVH